MAFPLAAIGAGLNLIGGIEGMLGGASAEKAAKMAQMKAIQDMQTAAEEDYARSLRAGLQGQYSLAGNLSDNLLSMGRGLGSSLAGAGVYNSSATAGALANQGAANAQTLGQYSSNLTNTLAGIRARARDEAAQAQLGIAGNDVNYARQLQAGGISGIASALGTLGQINWGGTGGRAVSANASGPAMNGMANSVLAQPGSMAFNANPAPGIQSLGGYAWKRNALSGMFG